MLNCSSGYFNGSLSVDDCIACVPNDDVTFGFNYYLFLMCLGGTMFLCLVLLAVNRARSGEWSLGILRFTLRSSLAIGYFILWGTIPYLYRRTNGPGYISGFDYNDFVICGTPSVCTSFIADKMGSTFLSASTIVATMSALLRAVMGYRFTRWNASKWGYRASVVLDAGFSVQYAPLLVLNDGNFGCFSNPMWQGNPSTSFVFLALCLLYIGAILSDIRVAQQAPPVGMLAMGGIMMLYGTGYLVARLAMAPNGSDVARTLLFIAPSFVLTAMVNAMALAARCKSLWTVDEQTAKRRLVPYGLGDPYVDELSHFGSSLVRLVRENNCRTLTTSTEWTETLVEAGKVLTVHWSNRSNANHSGFAWGHDDTNVCDHDAFGQPDITALAGYCARQRLPATAGPAAGTTQLQFSILNAFFAPVEHAGFSSTMMTLWRSGRQNTVCSRVWDAPEFEPTRVLTKGFLDLVGAFPTVEPVPPPTAAYAATRRASGVPRTPDEITATRSTRSTTTAAHVTPKGVEVRFARLMIGDPHTHVALRQYSRECAAIRWNCMVEVVAVDSAAFMELLEWPGAALIVTVPAWAVRKVEIANGFKFVVLPETSFEIMDVEVPTTAPRVDGEDSEPDVDPLTDDLLGDQASPPLALGDVHVPATHSPRGSASSARSDNLNPHRTLPLIVISHLQLTFDPWLVSDADL